MTLADCTDYIILKTTEGGSELNHLKLQKLAYYTQAWHLAFNRFPLFVGRFEAWVHGPVNRTLYKRFVGNGVMYAAVSANDITPGFASARIPLSERVHVDNVLDVYAGMTGTQLELATHDEEPWIAARGGLPAHARCETEIDEALMASYYAKRISA